MEGYETKLADKNRLVSITISRTLFERTKNFVAALQTKHPSLTFEGIVHIALENMVVSFEALNHGAPFDQRMGPLQNGRPPPRLPPNRNPEEIDQ